MPIASTFLLGLFTAIGVASAGWEPSSCPPAEAARFLAGRHGTRAELNKDGAYWFRTRLPGVQAKSSGGTRYAVMVVANIKTDGATGSHVGFALRSSGTVTSRITSTAKEWKGQELAALRRHCAGTDWSERTTDSASDIGGTHKSRCERMGGAQRTTHLSKTYIGREMVWEGKTLRANGSELDVMDAATVRTCTQDGSRLAGPFEVSPDRTIGEQRQNPPPTVTAFYKDGRLEGELVVRHKGTSAPLSITPFEHGLHHGLMRVFASDGSGAPLRAVIFNEGTAQACAGACRQTIHAELPDVEEPEASRFPEHADFLGAMTAAAARQRAELEADAARRRDRLEALERHQQARRERSAASSTAAAAAVAQQAIAQRCEQTKVATVRLQDDGWFYVVGVASCPERIKIGSSTKTILVRKRFAIQVAPTAEGGWERRWGVHFSDL